MGRPLRIEYPGAFYHVTSRGNEKREVFKSQRDRGKFLEYLESATVRYGARFHAYCLMTNHYHALVETPLGNLSEIMQHVNGAYTNYFNTKRRRCGHLLQGRYKAILVERDEYGLELSRYIHLNPVRAQMVDRPEAYRWSSYRAYIGAAEPPEWLCRNLVLGDFGAASGGAEESYRRFVEAALERECANPLDEVVASTLLGSAGFVEWVKEQFLKEKPADRDLAALRSLVDRPSIEAIRQAAEEELGVDPRLSRRVALYLCHRLSGRRLREIGEAFGVGLSGVTQASRRAAEEISRSTELAEAVDRARRALEK
jgi:putative transposase